MSHTNHSLVSKFEPKLCKLQPNDICSTPSILTKSISIQRPSFLFFGILVSDIHNAIMSTRIVPSILNLFQALQTLGLSDSIKLSLPQVAYVVFNSYPPSSATFDPYLFFRYTSSSTIPIRQSFVVHG